MVIGKGKHDPETFRDFFRNKKLKYMKESVRTVFKCDHCGKNYLRKHACEKHEKYCGKNPKNHHVCFHCAHLLVDQVNNGDFVEKTFHCQTKGIYLHSFKAERINHSCLGNTERMPLQCNEYKSEYDTILY